ncbi:hypothetical protein B0H14DRAFT_3715844 [Mycena olivaceomarginata]|nr:hypothetical protein B0H14DRAFT_3715844 [Mycena olivaceomarginata]
MMEGIINGFTELAVDLTPLRISRFSSSHSPTILNGRFRSTSKRARRDLRSPVQNGVQVLNERYFDEIKKLQHCRMWQGPDSGGQSSCDQDRNEIAELPKQTRLAGVVTPTQQERQSLKEPWNHLGVVTKRADNEAANGLSRRKGRFAEARPSVVGADGYVPERRQLHQRGLPCRGDNLNAAERGAPVKVCDCLCRGGGLSTTSKIWPSAVVSAGCDSREKRAGVRANAVGPQRNIHTGGSAVTIARPPEPHPMREAWPGKWGYPRGVIVGVRIQKTMIWESNPPILSFSGAAPDRMSWPPKDASAVLPCVGKNEHERQTIRYGDRPENLDKNTWERKEWRYQSVFRLEMVPVNDGRFESWNKPYGTWCDSFSFTATLISPVFLMR